MNTLSTVIAQIIAFSPLHEFRKCVKRYGGDYKIKSFSCFNQFVAMPLVQLAYRERLHDIESCLRSIRHGLARKCFLEHFSLRQRTLRLADLCRFRPDLHSPSEGSPYRRRFRTRTLTLSPFLDSFGAF